MIFNRYRAFAVHLAGSICIGLLSAALVFFVWYPGPLAPATGVTQIFLILLAVDVVIGPCITLIVFNPAKKELKRDMAVVLVLQVAALLYGLHTVVVARPVYIVFNVDRFDLVFANELPDEKLADAKDASFKRLPWWGPRIIAAERPAAGKERNDVLMRSLTTGEDVAQLPRYYVAYEAMAREARGRAQDLDRLRSLNPTRIADVQPLFDRYKNRSAVGFLPMRGKVDDAAVIVDRDSGRVLEIVAVQPW